MDDPLDREDLRPFRDVIAADLAVGDRLPAQAPGGRIEPHRLLDNALGIPQPGDVPRPRGPDAEDLLKLVDQPGLNLGMPGQQVQAYDRASAVVSCPASSRVTISSRSCRSVSRLPSRHRAASNRESTSLTSPSPLTPADKLGDDPVQPATARRNRRFGGTGGRRSSGVQKNGLRKWSLMTPIAAAIASASRRGRRRRGTDRDIERHPDQVLVDVPDLPSRQDAIIRPAPATITGGVAPDLLGEEGRLDQPALSTPELPLAAQQPLAEHRGADLEGAVLDEVVLERSTFSIWSGWLNGSRAWPSRADGIAELLASGP